MRFTKMEGLGNDYIYVSGFTETLPDDPASVAVAISDRHFGVGADGLILIFPSDNSDARMEMYNADGSRGKMCGNGIRCVAKYVYDHGIARKNQLVIDTDSGPRTLELTIENGLVSMVHVNMGAPTLERSSIPMTGPSGQVVAEELIVADRTFKVTALSMGNPHCVIFVDSLDTFEFEEYGPRLAVHESFPQGTNAEFVEVIDTKNVRMRVWERGSGETLSCGSGACAVGVAAVLNDLTERGVTVGLPGGDLLIEWAEADDCVHMTGPAREVFEGEWQ